MAGKDLDKGKTYTGGAKSLHTERESSRPVYPYGFAVIPTDSDLKFRSYAGWVKNYGHCPIFPFPQLE